MLSIHCNSKTRQTHFKMLWFYLFLQGSPDPTLIKQIAMSHGTKNLDGKEAWRAHHASSGAKKDERKTLG